MAAKVYQKFKSDEDGQAIFEVLVFLPLLIFLYTIIYNVGNAINISINQQKVTRRYFYYLSKGNSFLPSQDDLQEYSSGNLRVGMSMIGFRAKTGGGGASGNSVAPCFRFNSFLTGSSSETCDEGTTGERSTSFVRIFTAYGICGDTYSMIDGHWVSMFEPGDGSPDPRSNSTNCSNQ